MNYEPLVTAFQARNQSQVREHYRQVKARLWAQRRRPPPLPVIVEPAPLDLPVKVDWVRITGHDIIRATAAYFAVPVAEMIGPCRQRRIVVPRRVAIWIMKTRLQRFSQPMIGKMFGQDHSTVIYHLRFVATHREQYANAIAEVERRLFL